ncbi:uncharacterized protein LOC106137400 [Amyelois transitella]|uniref:uncharacterized protein LOC106137400 n=1 Tax=Amyelois transitella TaxID=680683 RepID=UPI00067E08AA|nr:uncharacterized protein LOC106137400 [Amyelois transitella]
MTDSNVSNPEIPEALLTIRSESSKSDTKSKGEPRNSYEVFRNHTTAVEVIVKEVPYKSKKSIDDINLSKQNLKIRGLEETNAMLLEDLHKSNANLVRTTSRLKMVFAEMKKQVETAYSHEAEAQERYLNLQLENEKLKALLESKTNFVAKLKKEMCNLKKVIKFVVKSISAVPAVSQVSFTSDTEYDIFEKDLSKGDHVKFLGSLYDGTITFNSTALSRDMKCSIEKRF